MIYSFTPDSPAKNGEIPTLISGDESLTCNGKEYLYTNNNGIEGIYEIRYAVSCSPFKEAMVMDGLLAVGYEEYFYLFNLLQNKNVLRLKVEGYFGHLYAQEGLFYVADANGIYCIDTTGEIHWQNKELGIDGVLINNFEEDKIYGTGEWDPPGGWVDFVLDKQTGLTSTP